MFRQIPDRITDLIWVATGFIGDVILTTAGTELAALQFPDARQQIITTPVGMKALAHSRGIAQLIALDKRNGSTLQSFRAVQKQVVSGLSRPEGTVVLQAHRSFRSSLLCSYLGYPTITYTESNLAFLADRKVTRVAVFHETARIAMLLEPLGVERDLIRAARPFLNTGELRAEIAGLIPAAGGPLVAVAPGSVWGTKRWTTEGYTGLVKKLIDDGARVVLIGSPAEAPVAAEIFSAINRPDVLADLTGKTNLEDLPALFARCVVLISNDSSPIHFASAINLATVGVFGATIPEMGFGPVADRSETVGHELPCRPCSDHGPMTCPLGHFKCMKDLSVYSVYEKVKPLLPA